MLKKVLCCKESFTEPTCFASPGRPIAVQLNTYFWKAYSEWGRREAESFQGARVDLLLCSCGADWLRSHIIGARNTPTCCACLEDIHFKSCQGSQNCERRIPSRAQLVQRSGKRMASPLENLTPWINSNDYRSVVDSAPWCCCCCPLPTLTPEFGPTNTQLTDLCVRLEECFAINKSVACAVV